MEVKDLFPFVLTLLLVGMICGVGVLLLDGFSDAVRDDTAVLAENVTLTSGAGAVTNTYVRSIESCISFITGNASHWTLTTGAEGSGAECIYNDYGAIFVNDSTYTAVQLDYTAGIASTTSGIVDSSKSAVGGIATDWFSLIVTIGILALILGLTIAGFMYFGNRR